MVQNVVLDTNVVLDWLVFGDPAAQPLGAALQRGSMRWVASAPMLGELRDVLTRPLDARWEEQRKLAITFDFESTVSVVEPQVLPVSRRLPCTDPDDQKFIDLALSWPVRWLFTRDRALLRLARRAHAFGVTVMPPAHWQPE